MAAVVRPTFPLTGSPFSQQPAGRPRPLARLVSSLRAGGGTVSHVAHLGGLVFGYAWVKWGRGVRLDPFGALDRHDRQGKIDRAGKRFQVYLKKRNSGDRWIN